MSEAENCGYWFTLMLFTPMIFVGLIWCVDWLHCKYDKYKYEKSFKVGDRFGLHFYKDEDNPFIKDNESYEVEITDVRKNRKDVLWIKFRYLSDKRYKEHMICKGDKVINSFEMPSKQFEKYFDKF